MTLDLQPLRFHFVALDTIHFPGGQPGNILRGGFGTVLRRVAGEDAYARLFAPVSISGPSGFADPPRPFVFRARQLDGRTLSPGEAFQFEVNLFDLAEASVEIFTQAFVELARQGMGPGRGRARLEQVESPAEPLRLVLDPPKEPAEHIRVEFLTPTELKPVNRPEFGVLFARARDRISILRSRYGPGPVTIDFRASGERASAVRMTHCEIQPVEAGRRSSRTGQVHPIGGFTGAAEYEGDLAEFIPYLEAAAFTGVGRHTVWGNGEIRIARLQ
jgi:hypothetical protein